MLNLLDAYYGKALNFVFSSSCTVYGQPDVLPVTESAPVKEAQSPLCAEYQTNSRGDIEGYGCIGCLTDKGGFITLL